MSSNYNHPEVDRISLATKTMIFVGSYSMQPYIEPIGNLQNVVKWFWLLKVWVMLGIYNGHFEDHILSTPGRLYTYTRTDAYAIYTHFAHACHDGCLYS